MCSVPLDTGADVHFFTQKQTAAFLKSKVVLVLGQWTHSLFGSCGLYGR